MQKLSCRQTDSPQSFGSFR